MTSRIHYRLTAAVACGLLFTVGSELQAEAPPAPATRNEIQPTESLGGAHLFSGGMRISTARNESPFRLASLPQKTVVKEAELVAAEKRVAAPVEVAPTMGTLATLPRSDASMGAPLVKAEVQAAAPLEPGKPGATLAGLPARQSGPTVVLQATEVLRAERPELAMGEVDLANLPRFPEPAAGESPAAVFAGRGADHRMVGAGEFRLASLQPRYGEPAGPLQPAEVLPIPNPNNPATPYAPAIDIDRPIGALTTSIAPTTGKLPADLAMQKFHGEYPAWLPRDWEGVTYFWDAPDLCYGPLRYEEANLERFGYTHCPILQPAVSGAHFFCATLALPYTMTMRPHGECIYPLGHYRPGSPVPYRPIWPEWRPLAAATEVGTIAGLILLIP